ncbi:DUF3939 domain-containing protein, partial [Klebsiella pneumoniae]
LERFNAIREEGKEFPKKIDFLQKSVNRFIANGKLNPKGKNDKENKEINFLDKMSEKYDKDQAQINREIFLGDLIGQE